MKITLIEVTITDGCDTIDIQKPIIIESNHYKCLSDKQIEEMCIDLKNDYLGSKLNNYRVKNWCCFDYDVVGVFK